MTATSTKARSLLVQARTRLVLNHPFVGALALRLELVEDASIETLCTDGARLCYNPAYVQSLSPELLRSAVAHEVFHCALSHVFTHRIGKRDLRLWNVAADHAVNLVLVAAGLPIGANWLADRKYTGWSVEQVYADLSRMRSAAQAAGESAQPNNQGGRRPGALEPTPSNGPGMDIIPAEDGTISGNASAPSESGWAVAVTQAAMGARMAGKLPAAFATFVDELLRPRIDWRAALRAFVQQSARSDYSWRMPSPSYAPSGLYLPALKSDAMPPLVVAIDSSGSISDAECAQFVSEAAAIMDEVRPERMYVVYADAAVHRVDEFEPGDQVIPNVVGRGGTDFRPVFDWVAERGVEPACLIYLTDGIGDYPKAEPGYPVLWVMTSNVVPPFGSTISATLVE